LSVDEIKKRSGSHQRLNSTVIAAYGASSRRPRGSTVHCAKRALMAFCYCRYVTPSDGLIDNRRRLQTSNSVFLPREGIPFSAIRSFKSPDFGAKIFCSSTGGLLPVLSETIRVSSSLLPGHASEGLPGPGTVPDADHPWKFPRRGICPQSSCGSPKGTRRTPGQLAYPGARRAGCWATAQPHEHFAIWAGPVAELRSMLGHDPLGINLMGRPSGKGIST